MERKIVSGIMLVLLSAGILDLTLTFTVQVVRAGSEIIYVDAKNVGDPFEDGSQEHPFDKVQEGVNSARSGDIVYVYNGIYYEDIFISKSISLIGQDNSNTIIDGHTTASNTVVFIVTDNVNISNFRIRNDYFGILLAYSNDCSIVGNNLENCDESIEVDHSNGSLITGNKVSSNYVGIFVYYSFDGIFMGNNASENYFGIDVYASGNCSILANVAYSNERGIMVRHSRNCSVSSNIIVDNIDYGLDLEWSNDSIVYHNNFLNNREHVLFWNSLETIWDDGYPSGGNYWNDYSVRYPLVKDEHQGENQDVLGSDGIWDGPYEIDVDNQDRYPLVNPWSPLPVTIEELKTEIEKRWSESEINNQGIVKSLIAKLDVAERLIDLGRVNEAKKALQCFIKQVQKLSGICITTEAADILIESAEYVESHL